MATRSTPPAPQSAPNYTVPFIIVTALFGIFGFLTNLNSNLAPKLEDIFNLNHMWSNFVTTSWFLAYLVFSVPSGKLIEMIGYKRTMVTSLFIMVIGALLFIPAAIYVNFAFFLTASFVLATGVCVLQTSANPYVSILGPEDSASIRLNLAQAFNSIGGTHLVGFRTALTRSLNAYGNKTRFDGRYAYTIFGCGEDALQLRLVADLHAEHVAFGVGKIIVHHQLAGLLGIVDDQPHD